MRHLAKFLMMHLDPFWTDSSELNLIKLKHKNVLTTHDEISAILLEPVQGEGGIVPCDRSYLQELRDICNQQNILLMVDEVQSGFCRTGRWFGYQHSVSHPMLLW